MSYSVGLTLLDDVDQRTLFLLQSLNKSFAIFMLYYSKQYQVFGRA